jgi:hypothetical protein
MHCAAILGSPCFCLLYGPSIDLDGYFLVLRLCHLPILVIAGNCVVLVGNPFGEWDALRWNSACNIGVEKKQ